MEDINKRSIAILADAHGLLEPTAAVLEDIRRRGITEIYSLGDNIGRGPNPGEVVDLLEEYSVISIAGNYEDYVTLGIEPFIGYFDTLKTRSYLWTLSKLNEHQKGIISLYPHSIELLVGGKKLALCHFANDVRFDYDQNSTSAYQARIEYGMPGYGQFAYTNSNEQLKYISNILSKYGKDNPMMRGFLSATCDPLFSGKRVGFFDAVIQGHVHWKIYESSNSTEYYSIRAVGMAYKNDPIDTASYVILNETDTGFDLEEVLVRFDREKMEYSIITSNSPDIQIYRYVDFGRRK